jgi:hypothetical protein
MRTLTSATHDIEAISSRGSTAAPAIQNWITSLLPMAILALGVVLTAVWTAGLLCLALLLVLFLI